MTLGLFIRDASNVSREITELVIRDGANTARTISELWIRDTNNVPRLVFNPSGSATFSVTIAPPGATGFSFGSGIATTNSVEATPTGGTAPYTCVWNLISHTSLAAPPTADDPTTSITTFTQTAIDPDTEEFSQWTATLTDSLGNMATSDEITASFKDIS